MGRAIVALLALWLLGAFFLPLGGTIHFLPVAALMLWVIHRAGRSDPSEE